MELDLFIFQSLTIRVRIYRPSVSRAGCLSLPLTLLLLSGECSGRILLPRSLLCLGCALGFTRAVCASAAEAAFRVLVC